VTDLRAQLETLGRILNVEITLLPDGVIHLYIPYDPRGSPIYVISPLGEVEEVNLNLKENLEWRKLDL